MSKTMQDKETKIKIRDFIAMPFLLVTIILYVLTVLIGEKYTFEYIKRLGRLAEDSENEVLNNLLKDPNAR